MPGESKKISELESASSLNNGDLLELASVNALSETGYSSKKTTIEDVADKIATLNPQAQADWTEADNTEPSYIQNKPTLAAVATSGSYNDLQDQPQIPAAQVNSDWNSVSGVSEILNKPTLGTAASKNTGVANGVAELDANGLVPTSQLPAYVDDVLEYASQSAFPVTGETGKIYVALDTNLTYRWSGSAYVEISPSLALGETSSTAYAGNKGKANADAISAIQSTLSGLATVATTGDYDDLIDKPAINDATITFTQGGTTKGTITLNQAADATIALDAGGGGSGGHTILDDEGTSLTQRTDLQFKGAYSVDNNTDQITEVNVVREMTKAEFDLLSSDEKVGIINVTDESGSLSGGAYIDTDTEIQAQTAIPANTDVTYTATQDCVVVYYINIAANSMGVVSVDGVTVDGGWRTTLTGLRGFVFLATGQTITLRQTYTTENGVYTVYGVLGGSSEGGSSYSETELLSAPVQVGASSITLTDNISNYDLLVFEVGVFVDNINQTFTSVALVSNTVNNPSDKTFIGGTVSANNNVYCVYFGIKYSSETQLTIIDSNRTGWSQAGQIISIKGIKYGSGSSSGHNYSTSEQVVGTWVDGSTIYEQSFAITNQTISTGWTVLVSGISIDKMISGEVCISGGGYDYTWNALYYNNGNIAVYNFLGGAIQSANGYVTIRYTKSTT